MPENTEKTQLPEVAPADPVVEAEGEWLDKDNLTFSEEDSLAQYTVTKSNSLLRASYALSMQEQRLIASAMSKLDPRFYGTKKNNNQSVITISASEFASTWKLSPKKVYEELEESANRLYNRSITEIDGEKVTDMRWIHTRIYHKKQGWVELHFTPKVLVHLTRLRSNFTSYRLGELADLTSGYSMRLFDLLAQFKDTGIARYSLEDFTSMLALTYTRFADIKRRVIVTAVEDLQANSNMNIEWSTIKKPGSRQVTGLEFRFSEKPQKDLF